MQVNPERAPEIMEVDIKRLEELLGNNNRLETESFSLDQQLTNVSLTRVVDPDADQLILQHSDIIEIIDDLTDYAKTAELLARMEGLKVNAHGDAIAGYDLRQVITDSLGSTSSIAIAVGTNGCVRKIDSNTKLTNQKQVDELVNPMLETLSNCKNDSRKSVQSIIDLNRQTEAAKKAQGFDNYQPTEALGLSGKEDYIIARKRLSRAEVIERLEQIKSALRAKVVALSKQAS